jgi:type IV secretory pathway VirB2 component (pilin)
MSFDAAPPESNAIIASVDWVRIMLTGNLASTLAVIAVACIGLVLLSGRIPSRRGFEVLFGCFIIFGATSIAHGLVQVLQNADRHELTRSHSATIALEPSTIRSPSPVTEFDPYARAALPPRR